MSHCHSALTLVTRISFVMWHLLSGVLHWSSFPVEVRTACLTSLISTHERVSRGWPPDVLWYPSDNQSSCSTRVPYDIVDSILFRTTIISDNRAVKFPSPSGKMKGWVKMFLHRLESKNVFMVRLESFATGRLFRSKSAPLLSHHTHAQISEISYHLYMVYYLSIHFEK